MYDNYHPIDPQFVIYIVLYTPHEVVQHFWFMSTPYIRVSNGSVYFEVFTLLAAEIKTLLHFDHFCRRCRHRKSP